MYAILPQVILGCRVQLLNPEVPYPFKSSCKMDKLLDDILITSFIVQHPKPSMVVTRWISHKLLNPTRHLSHPVVKTASPPLRRSSRISVPPRRYGQDGNNLA